MKKNLLLILMLLVFLCSCRSQAPVLEADYQAQSLDVQLNHLTNQMVKSLSQENKTKIAIMEFPDLNGNISEFGKFIPEELTTRLFMTRRFEVLERQLLNKVLEEQNLGMSGLIDASSAAQIGKILGVDAIVTGTITDMGNMIRLNARMIATETAGVFAVASVSIEKEPHIAAMMNRISHNNLQPTEQATTDKPAHSPSGPQPDSPVLPALARATVEDFEFRVISSNLTHDNRVVVEVLITNTGAQDKDIWIGNRSRLFDNLGQEYGHSVRIIGTKQASRHGNMNHLFISQVPTRLTIEFPDFDTNAESVALLEIWLSGLRHNASLRNFTINR